MKSLPSMFIVISLFTAPSYAFGQDDDGTGIEIAGHYKSSTTLSDGQSKIIAKDILALSSTISKEKELARDNNLSLSLQGEASALYGQASQIVVDGVDINQSATYRSLEGFGNLKLAQELPDDWEAFAKAGVGVLYEDLKTNGGFEAQNKFQDLSPAARFQVGAKKKISEGLSLGVAVGTTEKLD